MDARRDADGFFPIEGYGVLGDGRTAALVASDGRIDWWAVPTLDAPPVCASLIDPENGGYFLVAPIHPVSSKLRYLEETNVLEAVHETATGTVRVVDSLNTGSAGRLPWTELARRVEGLCGQVEMEWAFVPGDRLGRCRPWLQLLDDGPVVHIEDQNLAVVTASAGEIAVRGADLRGRFIVKEGDSALVAVVATDAEPLPVPSPEHISARLDRTIDGWRRWTGMVTVPDVYAEEVRRSALALKLLLTESTGAIAAAATTSLPEAVGGPKNYDYRFSWVRDSSFALDALIQLGLGEEVHGAISWLLDALRRNGRKLEIFFTLGGDQTNVCEDVEVRGWRDSQPVRSGNTAAGQLQLGVYGDLLDAVSRYVGEGHVLDQDSARMLSDLADDCCDNWLKADSGIWELDELRHYTISKIGCWTALDRAAALARSGQLPDEHMPRWVETAGEIHRWVDEHCWSTAKQSYTFYAGTEDLDASVLLAGRTGFDRGTRLSGTIDAVVRELSWGPYVYRYTGMDKHEGAFIACTFWLVDALCHTGRRSEAVALMDQALPIGGPTGLLSEQADPANGELLGNLPQALSHLALINAAFSLNLE